MRAPLLILALTLIAFPARATRDAEAARARLRGLCPALLGGQESPAAMRPLEGKALVRALPRHLSASKMWRGAIRADNGTVTVTYTDVSPYPLFVSVRDMFQICPGLPGTGVAWLDSKRYDREGSGRIVKVGKYDGVASPDRLTFWVGDRCEVRLWSTPTTEGSHEISWAKRLRLSELERACSQRRPPKRAP